MQYIVPPQVTCAIWPVLPDVATVPSIKFQNSSMHSYVCLSAEISMVFCVPMLSQLPVQLTSYSLHAQRPAYDTQ